MLVVLSFSHRDKERAKSLLRLTYDLSGQALPYSLLLASDPAVLDNEIKDLAAQAFAEPSHMPVTTFSDSWPVAPNCYFEQVAKAIAGNTKEDWAWLEPDCCPLTRDSLYTWFREHQNCGKSFSGPIAPTVFPLLGGGWEERSKHLLGVAIYPHDYGHTSKLLRFMVANNQAILAADPRATPAAFDVFLEGETTPNAFESKVVQHAWRSHNYREENGRIIYDVQNDFNQEKFIRTSTVMVHGCKDDSLERIVRAKLLNERPVEIRYEPAVEQIIPEPPQISRPNSEVISRMVQFGNSEDKLKEVAIILTTLSRPRMNTANRMKLAMDARTLLTEAGIPCLETDEAKQILKAVARKKYARQPKMQFDARLSKSEGTPDWMLRPEVIARHQELRSMSENKLGYLALRSLSFAAAKKHNIKGSLKMKAAERIRVILADEFSQPFVGMTDIAA